MRYSDVKIKNIPDEFIEAVNKAGNNGKGLFVYGDTGVGKTYAIHALARAKKEKVYNFPEMLVSFRDSISKGTYYDNLRDLCREKYLFIDDMGAEKMSDFVAEFVYILVNRRYENMTKTIFSTNLGIDEFTQRYGDRVVSRIADMCEFIELKGCDRRLK